MRTIKKLMFGAGLVTTIVSASLNVYLLFYSKLAPFVLSIPTPNQFYQTVNVDELVGGFIFVGAIGVIGFRHHRRMLYGFLTSFISAGLYITTGVFSYVLTIPIDSLSILPVTVFGGVMTLAPVVTEKEPKQIWEHDYFTCPACHKMFEKPDYVLDLLDMRKYTVCPNIDCADSTGTRTEIEIDLEKIETEEQRINRIVKPFQEQIEVLQRALDTSNEREDAREIKVREQYEAQIEVLKKRIEEVKKQSAIKQEKQNV